MNEKETQNLLNLVEELRSEYQGMLSNVVEEIQPRLMKLAGDISELRHALEKVLDDMAEEQTLAYVLPPSDMMPSAGSVGVGKSGSIKEVKILERRWAWSNDRQCYEWQPTVKVTDIPYPGPGAHPPAPEVIRHPVSGNIDDEDAREWNEFWETHDEEEKANKETES